MNLFQKIYRKIPICSMGAMVAVMVLFAVSGCKDRSAIGDISASFTPSGEEQVRELGIYAGKDRVGDLRISRARGQWQGTDPVIQLSERVHLRISFRSDRFSITSSQTSYVGADLDLKASAGTMDFGAGSWETRVLKAEDGAYEREQVTAGSRSRDRIRVPEGALVSDVLPLYIENAQVQENKRIKLGVFNMTLGQEFPLTLEYRGATDNGKLYAMTYWGMEERIWIDDNGMVVREDMALGVSARAPGGKEKTGHLPLETILSQTAVPGVRIPEDLGGRDEAVVMLLGSFRTPPEGRWQRVNETDDGAAVTLIKPSIPSAGQRGPDMDLMPDDTFGLDLDSPRIRELSMEITGSLEDPWEKALAIGKWVNSELGKSMRECFSALQVLETGEGECQSHSLLMVSLCRAAGLPARFVYGVVYLPDREAFGFHTWVQVHVGDWIPIDPTLGNFPAGVDHLTLSVGGYQDQFRLFPYIMGKGGWRIEMGETDTETPFDKLRAGGDTGTRGESGD
jgi:transglutaminase-like putative cysteine protease